MNPFDFFWLTYALLLAILTVTIRGWNVNGVVPGLLWIAGAFWHLLMQWLRHRSWLRHRDSGFSPGTQHLALSAVVGLGLGMIGGTIWLLVTHTPR
jgi:hypothetical protein